MGIMSERVKVIFKRGGPSRKQNDAVRAVLDGIGVNFDAYGPTSTMVTLIEPIDPNLKKRYEQLQSQGFSFSVDGTGIFCFPPNDAPAIIRRFN